MFNTWDAYRTANMRDVDQVGTISPLSHVRHSINPYNRKKVSHIMINTYLSHIMSDIEFLQLSVIAHPPKNCSIKGFFNGF